LLAVYVATFALWMHSIWPWVLVGGLASTLASSGLFAQAYRAGYFRNRWDAFGHAAVILDILLEATLIATHQNKGFLLCALSFVFVVGGYRAILLRRESLARAVAPVRPA
jgi:hypothetical protein